MMGEYGAGARGMRGATVTSGGGGVVRGMGGMQISSCATYTFEPGELQRTHLPKPVDEQLLEKIHFTKPMFESFVYDHSKEGGNIPCLISMRWARSYPGSPDLNGVKNAVQTVEKMIGKKVKIMPANYQDWEKEEEEVSARNRQVANDGMLAKYGIRSNEAKGASHDLMRHRDELHRREIAQQFWDKQAEQAAEKGGVVVVIGYKEGPDSSDSGVGHEIALALKLGMTVIWVDRDGMSGAKYMQK